MSDVTLLRIGILIAGLILIAAIVFFGRPRKPGQGKRVARDGAPTGERREPTLGEQLEGELGADTNAPGDATAQAELELEAVVGDAIALATTGFPNVSVTTRLAGSAPVKADRIQIQQVLINLIRNACESADGRACQIEISSVKRVDHLEVCVADTGPGIAPDVLPTIFESFVTTKHDGLGIGLSADYDGR